MSAATWTIRPEPRLGPTGRVGVLDCPHGTTTLAFMRGANAPDLAETQLLAVAIAKHRMEEDCACADALVQRVAASQARL